MINLTRIPTSGNELFNLFLDKSSPKLSVRLATGSGQKGSQTILITNNFPLQTWVYVVVSVSSTFTDSYINGKLVTSTKLTNPPYVPSWSNNASPTFVTPSNKPAIYLTGLSRWDNPVDPQTVWTAYSKGNGNSTKGSLGATYHLDMTLSKDDNKYKLAFF